MTAAPFFVALALLLTEAPAAPQVDVQDVYFVDVQGIYLVRLHIGTPNPYLEEWGDALWERFESADKDGNLELDYAELSSVEIGTFELRHPATGLALGGLPSVKRVSFLDFDRAPRDSVISFEEWTTALGADCCRFHYVVSEQGNNVDPNADAIFDRLDADKSRQLSYEEGIKAEAKLRWLDVNDDELLSPQEIAGRALVQFGNVRRRNRLYYMALNPPTVSVLAPAPGILPASLAEDIYRSLRALTVGPAQNGDLLAANLAFPPPTLAAIDINADGILTAKEIAAWLAEHSPDAELKIALDPTIPAAKRVSVLGEITSSHSQMDETGILHLDWQGALIEISIELPPEEAAARESMTKLFAEADRDGNKYLSPDEVDLFGISLYEFRLADADNNEQLFLEEIFTFQESVNHLQSRRIGIEVAKKESTILELIDLNGDGRISRRELAHLQTQLRHWDRNSDGFLSRNEIPRSYQLRIFAGTKSGADAVSGAVALAAQSGASGIRITPPWYVSMDTNKDGDLSPREFLGTLSEFSRLDRDQDGLISAAEAKAAGPAYDE